MTTTEERNTAVRGKPLEPGQWCTSCGDVKACLHHPDPEGVIANAYWDVMKRAGKEKK